MNYTQLYWAVLIKCIHITLKWMHITLLAIVCDCIHMYAYLHAIVIMPTRLYAFLRWMDTTDVPNACKNAPFYFTHIKLHRNYAYTCSTTPLGGELLMHKTPGKYFTHIKTYRFLQWIYSTGNHIHWKYAWFYFTHIKMHRKYACTLLSSFRFDAYTRVYLIVVK